MILNAAAAPSQDNQLSESKSRRLNSQNKRQQKIVVNDKSVSQKDRNRRRVEGGGAGAGAKDLILQEGKKLQMALTEISNFESVDATNNRHDQ